MADVDTASSQPRPRKGQGRGASWATYQDWVTHRDIIQALYEGANLTLKKIMRVMEEEHNFFATERMYKARLKQWGLRKNYRYEEVNEMIRRESPPDSVLLKPQPQPAGRRLQVVNGQRTNGNIRFRRTARPYPASSSRSCFRTTSAPRVSFSLGAPDDILLPEHCGYLLRQYFSGAFDMGLWDLSQPQWLATNRQVVDWYNRVALAHGKLVGGQTRQGFQVLHACFDEYKTLLSLQDPRLVICTINAVFTTRDFPEIVQMLLKHTQNLSQIMYSTYHPLHQIIALLSKMGQGRLMECARHLVNCQIDTLRRHLPAENDFFKSVVISTTRSLAVNGLIDPDSAEASLLALPTNTSDAHRIAVALAQIFESARRYKDAQRIINNMLETVHPDNHLPSLVAYDTLFYVCSQEGDDKTIREASHRRINFCLKAFGPKNEWTLDAATDLERHLRNVGDVEAADKVFAEYGIPMHDVTDGISELEIKV